MPYINGILNHIRLNFCRKFYFYFIYMNLEYISCRCILNLNFTCYVNEAIHIETYFMSLLY